MRRGAQRRGYGVAEAADDHLQDKKRVRHERIGSCG